MERFYMFQKHNVQHIRLWRVGLLAVFLRWGHVNLSHKVTRLQNVKKQYNVTPVHMLLHFRYIWNHGRRGAKPPRDHPAGNLKNTDLKVW